MQTIPQQYQTSDGRKFTDEAEAKRHEVLVQAEQQYKEARHAFGLALAKTQKTADGKPFDFGGRGYRYVVRPNGSPPRLVEVSIYGGYGFDFDDRDGFVILQPAGEGSNRYVTRYAVHDLYADQHAADVALLAATEEWIAEHQAQLDKLRERVSPST